MSKRNTKSNTKTKTFYEEESQNLSPVHVSVDNADTVIEVAPFSGRNVRGVGFGW